MNSKLTRYKQLLNKLSRSNLVQFFIFLLLISFSSCKKEEDKVPPIVTIETPERNDNVDGEFGFILKGSIVDNENIKEMQIKLEPESPNNNSSYYRRIIINKSTHNFNEEVLIVDENFISGYYNLSVTAYDGTNFGVAGVRIYVEFDPIQFLGCLLANEINNQIIINRFNPDERSIISYGTSPFSFAGLAVNSRRKLFIIAEKDQRVITARTKSESTTVWSVTNPNVLGTYQYYSLITFDNFLYALSYNNEIEVLNKDGARQRIISTTYRPILITKTTNRIYTIEQSPSNGYYMGIYYTSGVQQNLIQTDFIPVGIESQESGDVYVIGNKSGLGKLMEYKSQATAFNLVKSFNYKVISSCYCDEKLYFNSTNGNLYEFSIGFNNGVQRASGIYADLMKCHQPTNQIYYNHNSQGSFGIFDANSNSKLYEQSYFSKVLDIDFLYSR